MSISRRSFLTGLLGIVSAPAICKAENLMKIWVPPKKIITPNPHFAQLPNLPIIALFKVDNPNLRYPSQFHPLHPQVTFKELDLS